MDGKDRQDRILKTRRETGRAARLGRWKDIRTISKHIALIDDTLTDEIVFGNHKICCLRTQLIDLRQEYMRFFDIAGRMSCTV